MHTKLFLFFICLVGLTGCLPAREPVAVTRPVVATALPMEMTAVPLTNTPPPAATATQVAAATATPTTTPVPTSTSEPAWPTTPILFVRDGALHRWLPQTNEVEWLVEGVNYPIYAPDIVVFFRETRPQEEFALIVFHIPTRTETELFRQPAGEIPNIRTGETRYVPPGTPITVSENGRWLAYTLENEETGISSLFVHEIQITNNHVEVSEVLFSHEPAVKLGWPFLGWPFPGLMWPTANELSWNEPDGIWVANLAATPVSSRIEILASTSTFLEPPMNPADQDKEPASVLTIYSPYQWSPNGRFLLVIEHFPGEGLSDVFQIIERGSNQQFQLPDSARGPLSDDAVWLDETRILHFRLDGLVRIWQIASEDEFLPTLESEFEAIPGSEYLEARNLLPLPNNHLRFSDTAGRGLYDLDLTTQKSLIIGDSNATGYHQHFWSPTGQYALWIAHPNQGETQVSLDFLNGETQVDLSHIFGLDSCCWYWESSGSE